MSEILVEVTRGDIVECVHRGNIAIVNNKGELLYYVGDPTKVTYSRSSAKPIQAMNVILSGADRKFNLSDAELSIMCASHYAEDFHIRTIHSIIEKIGIKTEDFLCGAEPSINIAYALIQARNNVTLSQIYNDCSGKHSGMLATCIHKGYSIKEYTSPNHPIQQDIKKVVSDMYGIEENKIIIGVDGCDVPVFGMPLFHIAQAYARVTTPSVLEENYKNATIRIFNAMNNHPEMVAGTNGFCTELIKNTNRKLIGKLGAEGVYCVGIKDKNIGIAVKMECGSIRALSSVVIKILEDLNILSENEKQALSKYKIKENKNSVNRTIGFIRPIFDIKKAI